MDTISETEQRVLHGLDGIDDERTIQVSLRDLLFTYQTIGELISFFHDRDHYPTLDTVTQFIGTRDNGALHLLWEVYYRKLYDVWPSDIRQGFDEGRFDKPLARRRAD
jgi:hypothetical protein